MTATLTRPARLSTDKREAIEEFLFAECDLIDTWRLTEWQALFADDGRYEVAPLGIDDDGTLDPADTLFLVADDRKRVEQRCIRLLKKSAHAENPRSRVRHLLGNLRIASDGDEIVTSASFIVHRIRRTEMMTYVGRVTHRLRPDGDGFRIVHKRANLDLETLKPQGTLSIIL